MIRNMGQALAKNFLGNAPVWYKQAIIAFLIINPIALTLLGPFVTGWVLIAEFIFTLAMALKCYPLQPGGLLAIQAILIGMASPQAVFNEALINFPVILLLMFMVAGIYFMRDLLLFTFTKLLLKIQSKIILSLIFSVVAAVLSAFLDALTVTAVIISVGVGFYSVYHRVASGKTFHHNDHDHSNDTTVEINKREQLSQFRAFLRSLLMHAVVGTALGGACTLVGEPQNLLIAKFAGWEFMDFIRVMAPVTVPVLIFGLITCVALEKFKWFSYGAELPTNVRHILEEFDLHQTETRALNDKAKLIVQAVVAVFLVLGLAFHIAEVGIIGLMVIVLLTAFNGIVEEHQIGHSFEEALPFTALLVVFFAIVAVIHEQHLFKPIIDAVLTMETDSQPGMFFLANGLLSVISDNVFVATVYISEIDAAYQAGSITKEHFHKLAVAVNTGTNLPSVATPNGQAAFLFLLTSALAPLVRLSYGRMVWMALPYTIVLATTGFLCVTFFI